MDVKKILMGEEMPDKNDPKYKERYEQEVEAGRKTARVLGLSRFTEWFQRWASTHTKTFFFGVIIIVMFLVFYNLFCIVTATRVSQAPAHAVERQEKRLYESGRIGHKREKISPVPGKMQTPQADISTMQEYSAYRLE